MVLFPPFRMVRGSRWIVHGQYSTASWAIAVVSYSEGVTLGGAVACGRYGVSRAIGIVSVQVICEMAPCCGPSPSYSIARGSETIRLSDAVVRGRYGVPQAVSEGVVLGGAQVMLRWAVYLRCRVAVRVSHGPLGSHGTARGVVLVGMWVYGTPQVFGV